MYFPPINVTAPPTPGRLVVDIQPGTYPNDIVLNRKGKQPVGIMGTQNFSVSSIDPTTLELAGAPVLYQKKGGIMASIADLNGDGVDDLIFQVEVKELELEIEDTTATVTCKNFDGISLEGSDTVNLKSK